MSRSWKLPIYEQLGALTNFIYNAKIHGIAKRSVFSIKSNVTAIQLLIYVFKKTFRTGKVTDLKIMKIKVSKFT